MKLGEWSAENYDLLVIEDIHVEQLVGRAYRKLRTRLQGVTFHGLKSLLRYRCGEVREGSSWSTLPSPPRPVLSAAT